LPGNVAIIVADVRLRVVMDGIDLAREVKMRWPLLPVILTFGHPRERIGELPPGVAYMRKPWRPLNAPIAAEQALASRVSCACLNSIRAKSLPGLTPQAPGHAVARDLALLPSRDGKFVARARWA
jgi:hypothetical protein